ncbi:hypothetical protein [Rufibacter roseus]
MTLLVLGSIISYSQNADLENIHPSIRKVVTTLESEGVDTMMVYYQYCVGCHSLNSSKECNDFLTARIIWKKSGKDFTQRVNCSKADSETSQTDSEAFKYFLENRLILAGRKPLAKGKFYPPLPLHYFGEDFYLKIGKGWYATNLHEDQMESKEWEKYS